MFRGRRQHGRNQQLKRRFCSERLSNDVNSMVIHKAPNQKAHARFFVTIVLQVRNVVITEGREKYFGGNREGVACGRCLEYLSVTILTIKMTKCCEGHHRNHDKSRNHLADILRDE